MYLYLILRGLEGIIKEGLKIFKLLIRHLSQCFGVTHWNLLIFWSIVLQSSQITLQVNHSILLLRCVPCGTRRQSFCSIFEHITTLVVSLSHWCLLSLVLINSLFKITIHAFVNYCALIKKNWATTSRYLHFCRCYYNLRCCYRLIIYSSISTLRNWWSSIHHSFFILLSLLLLLIYLF